MKSSLFQGFSRLAQRLINSTEVMASLWRLNLLPHVSSIDALILKQRIIVLPRHLLCFLLSLKRSSRLLLVPPVLRRLPPLFLQTTGRIHRKFDLLFAQLQDFAFSIRTVFLPPLLSSLDYYW